VPAANALPNFHFCHFFAVLCFPLVVVKFIHSTIPGKNLPINHPFWAMARPRVAGKPRSL
jgi:hypothetical protein